MMNWSISYNLNLKPVSLITQLERSNLRNGNQICESLLSVERWVRGEADGFLALDEYSRPFHTFLAASLLREAVMGNILVVPTYGNATTQYLAVSSLCMWVCTKEVLFKGKGHKIHILVRYDGMLGNGLVYVYQVLPIQCDKCLLYIHKIQIMYRIGLYDI